MANAPSVSFTKNAPKMTLVNMITTDTLEAQYNPPELTEALGANYAHLVIPGFSSTRKHFSHTEDSKFTFNMYFSALESGAGAAGLALLLQNRRFLQALLKPSKSAGSIASSGPPRTMFIWPNLITLTCVVTKLTFKYAQFNRETTPVGMTVGVEMEELGDVFVSMEDVLANGTQRGEGAGTGDN